MSDENGTIQLAGARLGHPRHICAFFHSKEDEFDTVLSFVKDGLDRNDKVFQVLDPCLRQSYLQYLEDEGVPVADAQRSGQLEVLGWDDAHMRGGRFDQYAMLELIEDILNAGRDQGFRLTRVTGNAEWAGKDRQTINNLLEYETRLNYILPKYDDPVVCTYDCSKFDAGIVMDILRTHPVALIGGILQVNPFYVPPDEFLAELRARANSDLRD